MYSLNLFFFFSEVENLTEKVQKCEAVSWNLRLDNTKTRIIIIVIVIIIIIIISIIIIIIIIIVISIANGATVAKQKKDLSGTFLPSKTKRNFRADITTHFYKALTYDFISVIILIKRYRLLLKVW